MIIAPYIPARLLQAMPIVHEWSDWDPYPLIPGNDPRAEAELGRVSHWAKLVFAIGCAEWVVARLAPELPDDRPGQFINACWAYELSEQYGLPDELNDEEWEGPILGPICLALATILNTRYGFDEDNAELDAAFAEQIAKYVIPNRQSFVHWRDAVIGRLINIASRDAAPLPGMRLPRQVLDPTVPIDVTRLTRLREQFIVQIDLTSNPFVRLTDES
jgi:hypothetical protein